MLQLNVAVERQTAVAEKGVILSSHADQPLAERRAFNQCLGSLGEIANRKIELPASHHALDVFEVWPSEQDLYVRGVGGQRGHQGRDEDELHEVIAMEGERPPAGFRRKLHRQGDHLSNDSHHVVELLAKLFGPWSEHQALGPAYQELIAKQRPRACERRTHGGLTNAKLLGRPRDVPLDEQNSQRRQEIEVDGSEVHGAHD